MKCDEFQVNWLEVCRVGAEELVNTWVAAECEFDRLVDKQRYKNNKIYLEIININLKGGKVGNFLSTRPINLNLVFLHLILIRIKKYLSYKYNSSCLVS